MLSYIITDEVHISARSGMWPAAMFLVRGADRDLGVTKALMHINYASALEKEGMRGRLRVAGASFFYGREARTGAEGKKLRRWWLRL